LQFFEGQNIGWLAYKSDTLIRLFSEKRLVWWAVSAGLWRDIVGRVYKLYLKMLHLYLDTLIIGHKFCSMLIILNKLTLQKELQNFMQIMFFGQKTHSITTKQKSKHKSLARAGIWTRDLSYPSLESYLSGTETTQHIHWS